MRRYERASTLLTSNRPVEDWGKLLGDVAAVTAMLDRILHHGHVLKCGPRSWRTKTAPGKCPDRIATPEQAFAKAQAGIAEETQHDVGLCIDERHVQVGPEHHQHALHFRVRNDEFGSLINQRGPRSKCPERAAGKKIGDEITASYRSLGPAEGSHLFSAAHCHRVALHQSPQWQRRHAPGRRIRTVPSELS